MKKGFEPYGYSTDTKTGFFTKEGRNIWGLVQTKTNEYGRVVSHKMYISNAGYVSKEQLNYVMNHEFGHMVLNNYAMGTSMTISKVISTDKLLDSEAHRAIQYMESRFLILNGWNNLNLGGVFCGTFIGRFVPQQELLNKLENLIIKIK